MDLKNEILRRLEVMPFEMQRKVLAYFDDLQQSLPVGENGAALLPFAGMLDGPSADEMTRIIKSGCEVVDPCEW